MLVLFIAMHGIIHVYLRIIHVEGIYIYIFDIVIKYKFDNYKIIGEKFELVVIIIVIDENNHNCNVIVIN